MGHYDDCYVYDRTHPRVQQKPLTEEEQRQFYKDVAKLLAEKERTKKKNNV